MTLASLFDGISGFPLAASRCDVTTAWTAEIDPQCRSVSARHFPEAVSVDDVKDCRDANGLVRPDILTAGWPCQGNSVAGKRGGMADERSGLWVEVRRVLAEFRPRWFLGENVPGLLSVNGGRDMGTVLRDLAELGYGTAYRVLDAQWFGVPQRRRRVFFVGCLGDWRRAAEVLFESDGLPWDSPPSRETGARVAANLTAGVAASRGVNRPGRRREDDTNIVVNCLDRHMGAGGVDDNSAQANHLIAAETYPCLRSGNQYNNSDPTMEAAMLVAHTLRGEGFDASEDGTGRGTPLIPVPFDTTQITSPGNYSNPKPNDPSHPLAAGAHPPAIAFQSSQSGVREVDAHATLDSNNGSRRHNGVATRSGVRRLTPRECERLQGFPDDWTRYAADGKELSDSARYRMLGNSVAVPCVEWIIRRIVEAAA